MCDVCPPLERHERQQETDGQRGVSSVLLKACKGCGRLIPQALTMCEQCEARQQSRHVTYNLIHAETHEQQSSICQRNGGS